MLFRSESKRIFGSVKMNVREFLSNSEWFNGQLPNEDKMDVSSKMAKVLGIGWDHRSDKIVLKLHKPAPKVVTKRKF